MPRTDIPTDIYYAIGVIMPTEITPRLYHVTINTCA